MLVSNPCDGKSRRDGAPGDSRNQPMKRKISTFVPTSGYGYRCLESGFPSLVQTIDAETIQPLMLILSDEISIDSSWRHPFFDFDCEDALEYKILSDLISQKIIKEVDVSKLLAAEDIGTVYSSGIAGCCLSYLDHKGIPVSPEKREAIFQGNSVAIDTLLQNGFGQMDLVILYDAIVTYALSGLSFSRVDDRKGSIVFFSKIASACEQFETTKDHPTNALDWAIEVGDRILPRAPLFLSKTNYRARLASPLERLGMRPTVPLREPRAEDSSTQSQLEKILRIRDSAAAKCLREEYNRLIICCESAQDFPRLPCLTEIERLWDEVSYLYNRKLRLSRSLDKFTDYLNVPAAIAGLIPLISTVATAIPLVMWGISKWSKQHATDIVRKMHPWYFVAEGLRELKAEYAGKEVRSGRGKR